MVAFGNGPLSYQWLADSNVIANVNSPTLTLSNAQFSDAAAYSVRVVDGSNSDASSPAHLAVRPKIVDQPRSQTVHPGDTVVLSVNAEGVGSLSYRWRRNGRVIPGQTNSTFVIANVQLSDAADYSVIVTHWFSWGPCSVLSSNAVLVVSGP